MATCLIDGKEFQIQLAQTPMVRNWLDVYNEKIFSINQGFDLSYCDSIIKILEKNKNLFNTFKLFLDKLEIVDLWDLQTISNLHLQIVNIQRHHTGITDFLNKRSNNDWDLIHELVHKQESQITNGTAEFSSTPTDKIHNSKALAHSWSWKELVTQQQFHDSASFERWHINFPTAELGRFPYECFRFSPDSWQQEGSMFGQLAVTLNIQLCKTHPRPHNGYEAWCEKQNLPPVGDNFPLANFIGEAPRELIYAKQLSIAK